MAERLLAVGDIHGCFDSFREMVENRIKLQKSDKLILLGDYIDRGYKSKEVIDYIMELTENGYDVIPLRGNHEVMLLDAYEDEENFELWFINGGITTLKSFNINSIFDIDPKYITFFRELQYFYSYEDFLFVHAGFDNFAANPFTDYYAMTWESREYYDNPILKNKTIIHGHKTITSYACEVSILKSRKVINIDTGCVYKHLDGYGKLTAYDCNARKTFVV
ncbi:MAG: metallophosphoesterase family protein [Lentimicrobium sp.]|jgi:serine/threonine protein phosphatase 1|nr:metallophosphoesterase family protein [Lentimicrobium sp.]